MKKAVVLLLLLVCALPVAAQDALARPLAKGTWDIGLFGGFGNGLGARSDFQFVQAGFRLGRVLTYEHGGGWLRGNLEMAGDVVPVQLVFPEDGTVYAAEIRPLVLKWNFTSGERVIPFFEIAGGLLFTSEGFPKPANSNFNYTPQFAGGLQIFSRHDRAVTLSVRGVHISNASLSTPNPGVNASIFVTVGYHWFK